MSPKLIGLLLAWVLLPWPQTADAPGCSATTAAALDAAETSSLRGEWAQADEVLRGQAASAGACREVMVAAWAWHGWLTAVAAAARGGTDEALAGVRAAADALGDPGPAASEAAYAKAVLRAAAVAAQDERDELPLWLEHARDLAARRALTRESARWPLPIDLVEGELWSSVDDYELAEASYARALAGRDSALAWRGLARARARRGNRPGACTAYERALTLALPPVASGLHRHRSPRLLARLRPLMPTYLPRRPRRPGRARAGAPARHLAAIRCARPSTTSTATRSACSRHRCRAARDSR